MHRLFFLFCCIALGVLGFVAVHLVKLGLTPDFSRNSESVNLTYEEFKATCAHDFDSLDNCDPVGATNISSHCRSWQDGYDDWTKMTMPVTGFHRLVDSMAAKIDRENASLQEGERIRTIRLYESSETRFPSNWPERKDLPEWWRPDYSRPDDCVCCLWEQQKSKDAYSRRARGWYWLYNRKTSLLWIYAWNHQHFDLSDSGDSTIPVRVLEQAPVLGP